MDYRYASIETRLENEELQSCKLPESDPEQSSQEGLLNGFQTTSSPEPDNKADPNQPLVVCHVCDKICADYQTLCLHVKVHYSDEESDDTRACNVCGESFQTSSQLQVHVEGHLTSRTHCCTVCGEVFRYLPQYLTHVATHPGVCPCMCGQIFAAKRSLQHHQETCFIVGRDPTSDTTKSFRCRVCTSVFGTVRSRRQHERIHQRDMLASTRITNYKLLLGDRFTCELCQQVSATIGNHRAHMRSHTGEKPYNCRHCLKSFASLQGRWQHERIHKRASNPPPLKLDIDPSAYATESIGKTGLNRINFPVTLKRASTEN